LVINRYTVLRSRIAVTDPATVSMVDNLEHALEERLETGHFMSLLILDVLSLYGGDA
jgi:hypothetical protein